MALTPFLPHFYHKPMSPSLTRGVVLGQQGAGDSYFAGPAKGPPARRGRDMVSPAEKSRPASGRFGSHFSAARKRESK